MTTKVAPFKSPGLATEKVLFTAFFLIERETKGAVRYMQVSDPEATTPYTTEEGAEVGTLYVRKVAFNGDIPKRLTGIFS